MLFPSVRRRWGRWRRIARGICRGSGRRGRVVLSLLAAGLALRRGGGFDFAAVRADAVSTMNVSRVRILGDGGYDVLFRCGGFDFEGYRVAIGIAEAEDLRDFMVEGACFAVSIAVTSGLRLGWHTLEAQLDWI